MISAWPNPPLNSDPACIVFRSLSSFRFLGSAQRLGAGGARLASFVRRHMVHLSFNRSGLAMLAIGFATAFGIGEFRHITAEGPLMIIASVILIPMDLIYRFTRKERHLFHSSGGGNLFFIPIWIWGLFWISLGTYYVKHTGA